MTDLPDPLFAEPLPSVAPDSAGAALLEVIGPALVAIRVTQMQRELVERRLDVARHAVYAAATAAMEDVWRLRRVVQVEEWTAEVARRDRDWSRAYRAWRAAFWIRHTVGDDIARSRLVLDRLRELLASSPALG